MSNNLNWALNPVPTIHSVEAIKIPSTLSTPCNYVQRKQPKQQLLQNGLVLVQKTLHCKTTFRNMGQFGGIFTKQLNQMRFVIMQMNMMTHSNCDIYQTPNILNFWFSRTEEFAPLFF